MELKRKANRSIVLSGIIVLLFFGVMFSGFILPKKLSGKYFVDSILTNVPSDGHHCQVDSGNGYVLYLSQSNKAELSFSDGKNQIKLKLYFNEEPELGKKLHIPGDNVQVCYREEGNILVFETFEGLGWIKFNSIDEKRAIGELDLKLVLPHHNFSNADYHYMGGGFSASMGE